MIDDATDFELIAHGLSVTSFGIDPPTCRATNSTGHNRQLATRLQRSGRGFIAATEVHGMTVLDALRHLGRIAPSVSDH